MGSIFRSAASVCAVAAILAYLGLISLSDLGGYVPWQTDLLALSLGAAMCGVILALAEEKAALLLVLASLISMPLFGGFWAYAAWGLLGGFVSPLQLLVSDYVLTYTLQRGLFLVGLGIVFGLFGVIIVQLFLPKLLRS